MSIPLPIFVAIPLIAAFLLPIFGKKRKAAATFLANLVTISLLVLALLSIGRRDVYQIGKWSIPLGINLVLDGLSSLLLLAISVVSSAAMMFSTRYMERYTAKSKYLSLFLLMVAGMNGVVLSVTSLICSSFWRLLRWHHTPLLVLGADPKSSRRRLSIWF
jgi:multicomponent Na+:H+ antiporter subunit D